MAPVSISSLPLSLSPISHLSHHHLSDSSQPTRQLHHDFTMKTAAVLSTLGALGAAGAGAANAAGIHRYV